MKIVLVKAAFQSQCDHVDCIALGASCGVDPACFRVCIEEIGAYVPPSLGHEI